MPVSSLKEGIADSRLNTKKMSAKINPVNEILVKKPGILNVPFANSAPSVVRKIKSNSLNRALPDQLVKSRLTVTAGRIISHARGKMKTARKHTPRAAINGTEYTGKLSRNNRQAPSKMIPRTANAMSSTVLGSFSARAWVKGLL